MGALAIEILNADEPASQCLHAELWPPYHHHSEARMTDKSGKNESTICGTHYVLI